MSWRISKPIVDSGRRSWARIAGAVATVVAIGFFLSVNVFPNVNNDGVEYLAYSQTIREQGLVHLGYRQIGYPLILAVERLVSHVVGIEPLLFAALTQRVLLGGGVLYAAWLWRWRSIPLVLLALTPSLLAYTNFILTEGLTVPFALILACLIAHHFRLVYPRGADLGAGDSTELWLSERNLALLTASSATAIAYLLLLIRLPFAVFGVVPLAFWIAARRRGRPTSSYLAGLLAYVVLSGLLIAGMTVENTREWGSSSPSVRTERSRYWSAWHLVFTLHPENRARLELAEFYDDGSPYPLIWEIEERHPVYVDQAAWLNDSISELLTAAGLRVQRQRLFSLAGALRGGRTDEVRPRIESMLDTDAANVESSIHWNDVSEDQGNQVFNDRYNGGLRPQAMITSPVFPEPPLPYVTSLLRWLLPVSLLVTTGLSLYTRRRLLGVVYLLPPLAYATAMAWLLADNARFLMTTTIYSVAGLSALWATLRGGSDPPFRLSGHHGIDEA